jgi:hypothetical protein
VATRFGFAKASSLECATVVKRIDAGISIDGRAQFSEFAKSLLVLEGKGKGASHTNALTSITGEVHGRDDLQRLRIGALEISLPNPRSVSDTLDNRR